MRRELFDVYVSGDIVIVLQGAHDGPLSLPQGILPPTGNRMDAPCCDVFKLKDGRLQVFDCYPSGPVILRQLGVLGNSIRCWSQSRPRLSESLRTPAQVGSA